MVTVRIYVLCDLAKFLRNIVGQSTGLVKAFKLEGQQIVAPNWYTTKCLPEILQEVNVRGLMLRHDNASSHTAGLTVEFLKQTQIRVTEHPPYSPDVAMWDFGLFFNLKKNVIFIQKKILLWL
ncbi:histone-lysine N-methyltransferase SETMAR [Trichonephila clavipes]|nr:histone-lysine N-methyltransferase SETMAR [Trichonephila clavipes]